MNDLTNTSVPKWADDFQTTVFNSLPDDEGKPWRVDFARKSEAITNWKDTYHKIMIAVLEIGLSEQIYYNRYITGSIIELHKDFSVVKKPLLYWFLCFRAFRLRRIAKRHMNFDYNRRTNNVCEYSALYWASFVTPASGCVGRAASYLVDKIGKEAYQFAGDRAFRDAEEHNENIIKDAMSTTSNDGKGPNSWMNAVGHSISPKHASNVAAEIAKKEKKEDAWRKIARRFLDI